MNVPKVGSLNDVLAYFQGPSPGTKINVRKWVPDEILAVWQKSKLEMAAAPICQICGAFELLVRRPGLLFSSVSVRI